MSAIRFAIAEADEMGPGSWRVRIAHNSNTKEIIVNVYDDEGFMRWPTIMVLDTPDLCTLFFDHDPRGLIAVINS